MTIMDAVRKHLQSCPLLDGERLNVDFLPAEAQSYSVEATPCKEWVKKFIDGSGVKQFEFALASREFFGNNIAQNADNLGFYEDFSEWLVKSGVPELDKGRTGRKFETLTSGYAYLQGAKSARYQIQCRFIYAVKG